MLPLTAWFVLFCALATSLHAANPCVPPEDENMSDEVFAQRFQPMFEKMIAGMLEQQKAMRLGASFTEADLEKIDKNSGWNLDELPHLKEFMKKAAPLRVRFVKAYYGQEGIDHDALKALVSETAKLHREGATFEVQKDFLKGKMVMCPESIQIVKDIAADTAALTAELTDKTGMEGYPESNSTFVKALSKKGNKKLYAVAGHFRCLFDSWSQFMPKREERLGLSPSCDYICVDQKRKEWHDHCSNWKEGAVSDAEIGMETIAVDFWQIIKTESGVRAVLDEATAYMENVKKILTFNTASESATDLASRSDFWKAVVTLIREVLKCKYNALGLQEKHPWTETTDAAFNLVKRLNANPPLEPAELARDTVNFITKYITVKNFLHVPCMFNATHMTRLYDSVEECFIPIEASAFAESKLSELKNTPESRAAFLEAIKPKSEAYHALNSIVLNTHLASAMNREGMTDAIKELIWEPMIFFTVVSQYIPDFHTKMMAQLATSRAGFVALTPAERAFMVEKFPMGMVTMLAMLY